MHLPDVRLVVHRPCEVCEGSGEVLSEDWEAFEEWRERPHGSASPEAFFLDFQGLDAVPPMKRECGNCEDGWVDDTVPFADLLAFVLEQVPHTVIARDDLRAVAEDVRLTITRAAAKSRGLADADDVGSWLRTVQEGAEALCALTEAIKEGSR